jgi:peptidoglycan hydrolase-like protein with peptidoglycan-binding domain
MPFNQPILQLGDSGEEVTRHQENLRAVGCFSNEADSSFGQPTLDAVVAAIHQYRCWNVPRNSRPRARMSPIPARMV